MKLIFWWHHNENSNEFSFFCLYRLFISKFRRLNVFALQQSLATLIACKNEFSPIRLYGFLSFVSIFAVNREYFLWGGKPHSLVLLK